MIKEIDTQTLKKQLDEKNSVVLIDVREPWELKLCSVEGSINVPLEVLPDRLDSLPMDQQIVIICHHGSRSKKAASLLSHCGFNDVVSVSGGIDSWALEIDHLMKRY